MPAQNFVFTELQWFKVPSCCHIIGAVNVTPWLYFCNISGFVYCIECRVVIIKSIVVMMCPLENAFATPRDRNAISRLFVQWWPTTHIRIRKLYSSDLNADVLHTSSAFLPSLWCCCPSIGPSLVTPIACDLHCHCSCPWGAEISPFHRDQP